MAMQRIRLEPVDGVHVTTIVDNSSDVLLPDEGLVRRWGPVGTAGLFACPNAPNAATPIATRAAADRATTRETRFMATSAS